MFVWGGGAAYLLNSCTRAFIVAHTLMKSERKASTSTVDKAALLEAAAPRVHD